MDPKPGTNIKRTALFAAIALVTVAILAGVLLRSPAKVTEPELNQATNATDDADAHAHGHAMPGPVEPLPPVNQQVLDAEAAERQHNFDMVKKLQERQKPK